MTSLEVNQLGLEMDSWYPWPIKARRRGAHRCFEGCAGECPIPASRDGARRGPGRLRHLREPSRAPAGGGKTSRSHAGIPDHRLLAKKGLEIAGRHPAAPRRATPWNTPYLTTGKPLPFPQSSAAAASARPGGGPRRSSIARLSGCFPLAACC